MCIIDRSSVYYWRLVYNKWVWNVEISYVYVDTKKKLYCPRKMLRICSWKIFLRNICVTNDRGHAQFGVITIQSFSYSWRINGYMYVTIVERLLQLLGWTQVLREGYSRGRIDWLNPLISHSSTQMKSCL